MKEREAIVRAWSQAQAACQEAVLATVVRLEGSGYRKPGARMLVLADGRRIGSVSGGCLEHEVAKKAFYLTAHGPRLARFSTRSEDGTPPYGMGCEGVVHILLSRLTPASPCAPIELLSACQRARARCVIATVLSATGEGAEAMVGKQWLRFPDARVAEDLDSAELTARIAAVSERILAEPAGSQQSTTCRIEHRGQRLELWFELVEPPHTLVVFGAGDDAQPVVRFARELGWHTSVVDGRRHYATRARFAGADEVRVIELAAPLEGLFIPETAACVLMTHSFEQDRAILDALLMRPLAYLGLLGPASRTELLLRELGPLQAARAAARADLHNPIGLDIGADSPEVIALAIVAEVQACFARRAAGRLSERPAAPGPQPTGRGSACG